MNPTAICMRCRKPCPGIGMVICQACYPIAFGGLQPINPMREVPKKGIECHCHDCAAKYNLEPSPSNYPCMRKKSQGSPKPRGVTKKSGEKKTEKAKKPRKPKKPKKKKDPFAVEAFAPKLNAF